MFIERGLELIQSSGFSAMVTMQSWMFLSSFEKFRDYLFNTSTIYSMAHIGAHGFDSIGGEVVQTTAFILERCVRKDYKGAFLKLVDGKSEMAKKQLIESIVQNPDSSLIYHIAISDLENIPGTPIAYWTAYGIQQAFSQYNYLEDIAPTRKGMVTARNSVYVRYWFENSLLKLGLDRHSCRNMAKKSEKKWFSYLKGGGYRRWYGNKLDVVNWEGDGYLLQNTKHPKEDRIWATNFNLDYIFKPNVNWGGITSSRFSARYSSGGELFDAGGSACFPKVQNSEVILGFLNSKIANNMLSVVNPTLNFQAGNIASLPISLDFGKNEIIPIISSLIKDSKKDWDAYETSWDFTTLPLLEDEYRKPALADTYKALRSHWQTMTDEMQRLEEENNRIFIEAYGLEDELTPDVPLKEITLTCNPYYRYGGDKTKDELEALLLADTMRELISYAVGCMFGRYSLDKPGLILANQGDTIEDYYQQIPEPSYAPDKDNVLPILDGEWFSDDIVDCFRRFLKTAFGEANYNENMQFIEMALGKNGKPRDIRDYFLKGFYDDHIKRYKKRPIYWMFSSGDFNALIYMHRYRSDTASVVLNEYLREFRIKIEAHKGRLQALNISSSATEGEKTKALKEIAKINKLVLELEEYERDTLYPLATKKIEIDLDDGVKVNYPKLGSALKSVKGLS